MPLFEFICKKCGNKFEKIVFSIDNEKILCPVCGSAEVEKQFSSFAAVGSKSHSHGHCCSHSTPSACASKKVSGECGGCCGM